MNEENHSTWDDDPMKGSRRKRSPKPDSVHPSSSILHPSKERLQKVLAQAGIGSRRECEKYITLGRVTIDDQVVTKLGTCADPSKQRIHFDGQLVRYEPKVYWWLNKPAGVLCTNRDTHGRETVLDLIPELGKRVYSVGRLDEQSTGLLLLTNDGQLADRLTHPRYGVPKTYHLLVAGKVSGAEIKKLLEGIWLSDGKVRAKEVRRLGFQGSATRLRIVLCEGHNREIRRMFSQIGHKVMRLERTAIGPTRLRKLRLGQSRPASPEEIRLLRELLRDSDQQDHSSPRSGRSERKTNGTSKRQSQSGGKTRAGKARNK